ncbi:MAG: hypothetical protein FWD95_00480 [Nocardioidaceae bacterium]|nr:hypothetical protein [Nocardioidaceae bacterium]
MLGPRVNLADRIVMAAGELSGTQDAWSLNDLDRACATSGDALFVWATHFPALTVRDDIVAAGFEYAGDLLNHYAVASHLTTLNGPVLVLGGHVHVRTHRINRNVLQLTQGALAESPHDLSTVRICAEEGRISVTRCARPVVPSDATPAVIDPSNLSFTWDGCTWHARHSASFQAGVR